MIVHLFFFFFNDTATTEIYTLSLHDALPIYDRRSGRSDRTADLRALARWFAEAEDDQAAHRLWRCAFGDRKSTRLNSSHANISYAVFCLKKKKKKEQIH